MITLRRHQVEAVDAVEVAFRAGVNIRRRPNDRATSIYWLVDERDGMPFYCGKTVLPLHQRLAAHKHEAAKGSRPVHAMVRNCGKYVTIHRMESVPPDGDWVAREKRWIFLLRQKNPHACNVADGGAGTPGRIVSEETRKKIVAGNLGRKHTAETRAKISRLLTGKRYSAERNAKMAARLKGRVISLEQRVKISTAQKARFAGPDGDRLRAQIGNYRRGVPVSAEARAKMRAAKLGRKLTDAEKEKLRAANTGRKMPAEAIAKSAANRTGQKRTPEQRERMRMAHQGKPWSQARREAYERSLR